MKSYHDFQEISTQVPNLWALGSLVFLEKILKDIVIQ